MCDYLDTSIDLDDPEVVSAMDDLPLWSAPFGLMLLERVPLKEGIRVLDVGCGSGFPLLEVAQSLGPSSAACGIDPWRAAHVRIRQKIKLLQIKNVSLIEGSGSAMPFKDSSFHVIVSNLGVNNFNAPQEIFDECFRVAKPKAQILLTTNPKGHMAEFFEVFEEVLRELERIDVMADLVKHIDHRMTAKAVGRCLEHSGFRLSSIHRNKFSLRFLDGRAFFRHALIRYGFLDEWKKLIPIQDQKKIFLKLEESLGKLAGIKGELRLTIPVACIAAEKPGSGY